MGRKMGRLGIVAAVLFACFALAPPSLMLTALASAPPMVFTSQLQTTKPGEVIQLNGAGFTSTTQAKLWVMRSTNWQETPSSSWVGTTIPTLPTSPPSDSTSLSVLNYTNDVVNLSFPITKASMGMYAIYSSTDGTNWTSSPYVFNHPRVYFLNYNTVAAGNAVKAMGINLQINSGTSYVYLYKSGSPVITCTLTNTSENELTFTVPAGTANGVYQVWVHNGKGGQYGFDNTASLTVATAPVDPTTTYNVTSSPYSADKTGVTDATSAIQSAIDAAAANSSGGVVYFPAGTYKISSRLNYTSTLANVIFKGDSNTTSTIKFSSGGTFVDEAMFYLRTPSQNANTTTTKIYNLGFDTSGKRTTGIELFGRNYVTVDNVKVKADNWTSADDLYSGVKAIGFGYNKEITISNSTIYGNDGLVGSSSIDVRIFGNSIYTVYPRNNREPDNDSIRLYGVKRAAIYSNLIDRNATQDDASNTYYNGRGVHFGGNKVYTYLFGSTDAAFAEDVYVSYNTIYNTGKPTANDGEIIVADGANINGGGITFNVSSATASTLTTSSTTGWAASSNVENELIGTYAYILGGTGVGQVRRITGYTSTSITVSPNWDLTPDSTSKFMVEKMHTRHVYANNTAYNNQKYIGIYGEGFLNTIANNSVDGGTYTDGGVTVFPYLGIISHDKYPVIYNEIRGNTMNKGSVFIPDDDYLYPNVTLDYSIARGNVFAGNTVTNYAQVVSLGGTARPTAIWNINNLIMNNTAGTGVTNNTVISSLSDRTVAVNATPLSDSGSNTNSLTLAKTPVVHVEAESYSSMSGVANNTTYIGSTDNGDWVKYSNINFGTGIDTFRARLALDPSNPGHSAEVRIDSLTGTVIGTLYTQPTLDWSTYVEQSTAVSGVTGTHDVYILFKVGAAGNFDWFEFLKP